MGKNAPRYIPQRSLVEITARTVGARYLLTPTPQLTARILGCMGRVLSLVPIQLHAFAFLSNHWHGLVSADSANVLSRFIQLLHSTVAVAVNELHGWDGKVFGKASQIVVAPDAEEDRLAYVLAQGAKEGLVESPYDWPGPHSARALAGFETLSGVWTDRALATRIRIGGGLGGGREPKQSEVEIHYPIELAALPAWRKLPPEECQARVRAMVVKIVEKARVDHPNPLGAERVIAQDPHERPVSPKRQRAPRVHTRDRETWLGFVLAKQEFENRYRTASAELRCGRSMPFPPMCFPPRAPFLSRASLLRTESVSEDEADRRRGPEGLTDPMELLPPKVSQT